MTLTHRLEHSQQLSYGFGAAWQCSQAEPKAFPICPTLCALTLMYGNRHSWVAAEAPKMRQQQAWQAGPQIDSECERGNDRPTIANCPAEISGSRRGGAGGRGTGKGGVGQKIHEAEWGKCWLSSDLTFRFVMAVRVSVFSCASVRMCICVCVCVCLCACCAPVYWPPAVDLSAAITVDLECFFAIFRSCCCCCGCWGCWHVFPRSTHRIQFAWFYFRFSSLAVLPFLLLSWPGGTCRLPVRIFLFSPSLSRSCFRTWFWFWFWFLAIPALATATWVCNLIWFSAVTAAFCRVLMASTPRPPSLLDGQLRSRLPLKLTLPNLSSAAVTRNCHFV